MKANELRIGNYLDFEGEFLPICSLHSDNTLRFIKNGISIGCFGLRYNTIKPIPLTEEILLKCGFERHHSDYFNETIYIKNVVGNTEFEWGVYPNELGSGFVIKNSINIKYLHQLQNLYFALTKEELNINL